MSIDNIQATIATVTKKQKTRALSRKPVDIDADIQLINEYSLKELKPEDVFVFSMVLCDNEVDRDFEKFADSALDELAPLFVGKTGIFNHSRNAKDQIARIYKAGVETIAEKNSLGKPIKQLIAYAYVLRTEYTNWVIEHIEGGILKEVSIGCSVKKNVCSICGSHMGWCECGEGHCRGKTYDKGLCYGILENPSDAYEFSFVAVPAQKGAGVTKSFEDIEHAFDVLLSADLGSYKEKAELLIVRCKDALLEDEERARRQKIISENKKYLKGEKNGTDTL